MSLAGTADQDCPLIVRVYADATKLANSTKQVATIRDFIAGFNATNPSFEYVDVGTRNDGVIKKITGE